MRPQELLAAAIVAAVALDVAAEQRAGSGAEQGAGGPLAMGVDGAADEGAGGAADEQADRPVGLAAIGAAVAAVPGAAMIALIIRLRGGGGGDRRHRRDHGRGGKGENELTHDTSFLCALSGGQRGLKGACFINLP